ncbi:MAG: IS3 family transposase [Pyrinomonadaceae bacterium]
MLNVIGLSEQKYYEWKSKYGEPFKHNAKQPKDFWLTEAEKTSIIEYAKANMESGYRRMCYEMMDANVAAVSPTTVFRILRDNGLLKRFPRSNSSRKGTGFEQPQQGNEHWHIDISHLNICGTFYYLCSILDGYSRKIIAWEIAETMTEGQVEIVLERAKEQYPQARARIISDNGPQFIARDFKEYIRISGMTHVRTSPYYPQSNGKIERYHQTLKNESIRQQVPLSLENAIKIVGEYVEKYNSQRLHSAIGYITPNDRMAGKSEEIWKARDEKLQKARTLRKLANANST